MKMRFSFLISVVSCLSVAREGDVVACKSADERCTYNPCCAGLTCYEDTVCIRSSAPPSSPSLRSCDSPFKSMCTGCNVTDPMVGEGGLVFCDMCHSHGNHTPHHHQIYQTHAPPYPMPPIIRCIECVTVIPCPVDTGCFNCTGCCVG